MRRPIMFDVQKIRSDFPILSQSIHGKPLVYLDNSATTQKPQQVIDSITNFYTTMNCNVHRSAHTLSQQASASYESVRTKVKNFIHAKKNEEIIFTSGTTESINLVAHAFANNLVSSHDEILISEMEHHSNIVPWQMLCEKKQATLKILPFDDTGRLQIEQLPQLLNKQTKLIALTYVSNVLGTINPVKKIISLAHQHNIPVLIDGAQAIQHLPIDVQDLDCDFFVFSGHKMYAGTGVGVLYAKEKWLHKMQPVTFGGGMISHVDFAKTTFAETPYKFEAGTQNISAVISLGEAIDYLTHIGMDNIKKNEHELLDYAQKKLQDISGITVYGTTSEKCCIISFNLQDIHHYDAMMILDKMGIAIRSGRHCADPIMNHYNIPGTLRASFALYNNKEDVDQLINGLKKVKEMHQ